MEAAVVEIVVDMLVENQQWNMQMKDYLILLPMLNGQEVSNQIYIYLFLHFKMYFCESLALFYYIHFLSGKPAEVYWVTTADHRGGYAYRICKV